MLPKGRKRMNFLAVWRSVKWKNFAKGLNLTQCSERGNWVNFSLKCALIQLYSHGSSKMLEKWRF